MKLAQIQNYCRESLFDSIELNLNDGSFISPATSVILGAMSIISQIQGKKFKFNIINASEKANPNDIPFTQIKEKDDIDNVVDNIMRLAPIRMTEEARGLLVSKFYELFVNAFDHADSDIGVFCCGHWILENRMLVFSVYDAGIGIPHNVRKFLNNPYLNTEDTLRWAFVSGNTTKEGIVDYPRGLGLNELENFVNLNHGKINLYSSDGYCFIEDANRTFGRMELQFLGTIFIMNVVADDDHIYVVE